MYRIFIQADGNKELSIDGYHYQTSDNSLSGAWRKMQPHIHHYNQHGGVAWMYPRTDYKAGVFKLIKGKSYSQLAGYATDSEGTEHKIIVKYVP